MDYYAKYQEMIYSGDPYMRGLFLVRNEYVPYILCALYVLISTKLGPAFMRNRKPFELRKTLIVFNFSLVAVYLTFFLLFLWTLQYADYHVFCKESRLQEGKPEKKIALLSYYLYLVKYVEFLDTIFFILRKKNNQISFLHITHHALLPLLCWLIARTERTVLQAIPLYMNAFVHIVMYTYYGLAAMGPEVRKRLWWKKYITQLQIVQFILVIILMTIIVPLAGCKAGVFTYVTNIVFVPLLLHLFYQFYRNEYKQNKKRREALMKMKNCENGEENLYLSSNDIRDGKKKE